MLTELLRPATPELARRWLAALLLVPRDERADVVEAIERRIVDTYGSSETPPSAAARDAPPRAKRRRA